MEIGADHQLEFCGLLQIRASQPAVAETYALKMNCGGWSVRCPSQSAATPAPAPPALFEVNRASGVEDQAPPN